MNLPRATTKVTATATGTERGAECGNCGSHNRWALHHVRLRGIHRRLCTSCVLRLHPASFCPSCFAFYDSAPPHPSKRLSCSNCSSFTHSHCSASAPNPFLCPPCKDPSFSFFDIKTKNNDDTGSAIRIIDKKLADALLCAAKIASASMGKAVIVARAEAERRVREAALARKRAREALEHVALLSTKENLLRRKEGSTEVSGSAHLDAKVRPNEGLDGLLMMKNDNGIAKEMDNSVANSSRFENHNGEQRLQISHVKPKQEDFSSK